ncbi:hypothetical protein JOM56_008735 [Amanita muscaria]
MSTNEHDFLFASLDSKPPPTARKVHIRRLYDVLQLCIQRQDYARAKRAWAILVRCKEVRWKSLWTIGLLLVGDNTNMSGVHEEKVDYLRSLMLHHLNDREAILIELVQCLVVAGKHQEALDEIELYLPSHPYQDNPILQIYTGFLSLYIAQEFPKDSARHSTLLEDAKSRLRRVKEIDPNNIIAQMFIEKITTLNEDHSPEPESELEMEVDEGIGPKTKRART